MRTVKFSLLLIVCAFVLILTGCVGEQQYNDLKIQNDTQRKRISELESQIQTSALKLNQMKNQLGTDQDRDGIEQNALHQTIMILEEDLMKKRELIAAMQQQLLYGGASLPVELSAMLEDFANREEMVTYDSSRGIVKFKSDLLFEPGSDTVAPSAANAVGALCRILASAQGQKFDIIIAGHTDDVRIGKPATRAKHPTNWHLSAHRAISVLNVMSKNKIPPSRLSIRGFGEYRPMAPNKAGKKGNPQNRRVEIYIVPKGV